MSSWRLFVAVELDDPAQRSLTGAVDGVRETAGAPRWTDPGLWHLTLVFLGELDLARLPAVRRTLGEAMRGRSPFHLRLSGAGTFPARGRPSVLWAGVGGDMAALESTARAARRAARAAGVRIERRRYHPHLTLGRWHPSGGATREAADALAGYAGPPFAIDRAALVRSHLGTPAAPTRYERLEEFRFG